LLKALVSSRNGLFFFSPVLLLGLVGLLLRRRMHEPRWFVTPILLGGVILWYLNASWYAWYFGDAFGGRGYIVLVPALVLGLGRLLRQAALVRSTIGWIVAACFVLALAWHVFLELGFHLRFYPRGLYWGFEGDLHVLGRDRF
jgi:cobalamin biosynthesis protein CobD/CbiB